MSDSAADRVTKPAVTPGVRLLAPLAATWCVLATLELLLNATLPEGAFGYGRVPPLGRVAAVCADLSGLTLALAVIGGCVMLFKWVDGRLPAVTVLSTTLRRMRPVFVWVLVVGYLVSWGMYYIVQRFLDSEGLVFWLAAPITFFYGVDPNFAVNLLTASLLLAAAIGSWLPHYVARSRPSRQRRLIRFTGVLVLLVLLGALLGEVTSEHPLSPLAPEPPYVSLRDKQAGPFAHVLGEIRVSAFGKANTTAGTSDIHITRRPIVPMETYLATIDRERVKRWNVIVIVVESLRADQLRAYGARRDVMPTLDALARDSRVYANAYTQASHSSYASPVPLSSQYPLRSRNIYIYPKNPPYPRVMMYDVLKPLGYNTAIFSSQNEHWQGMINYLQTAGLDRYFRAEVFDGPTYVMASDTGFAKWVKGTKSAGSVDDHFTINEAIRWIDDRKEQPFFMALNLQNSHLPYVVPDGFPRRFGPANPGFSIAFAMWPRGKAEVVKDLYADSLFYVDTQIERLFRHLRESGIWDNTVIVVTGDHGQAFYEHGFSAHASALFNEVMLVPLLIRAPGLTPGIDPRPAQHVDIAPSVFDLLGLPAHPNFQGQSLFGAHADPNRSLYMVVQSPLARQYAIVRSPYKLIFDDTNGRHLLFDLSRDPQERSDLALARPDIVRSLADRLFTWREAQLSYYTDPVRCGREYPPVLDD